MNAVKKVILNGMDMTVDAPPHARLIDVIRGQLQLAGTKEGCGEGECGACSVILNGEVVNSCLILFGQLADGDSLITIEGIASSGSLSEIQESFISRGAVQCGMCIPGMVVASYALLAKNAAPTRGEVAQGLSGNLCRCTGYVKIVDAVLDAAKKMRGKG
jgi:carbon-monoxide dehydrogenase small subunit